MRSSLSSRRRTPSSRSTPEAREPMSMDEDELDAIRRRKMAELQQAQVQAQAEQQYRGNQQAQRRQILRQILTPEARERLGRIELAYPELKESMEKQRIGLEQGGGVHRRIDD